MMLSLLPILAALAPLAPQGSAPEHFTVSASFQAPAKPGDPGAVVVRFTPLDPDVHINEEPSPRLKLDPAQKVLVDKQAPPPSHVAPFDPTSARYLDTTFPVSFPVAFSAKPPASSALVKADVVYYYCSKRDGWCRKGTSAVEFAVP